MIPKYVFIEEDSVRGSPHSFYLLSSLNILYTHRILLSVPTLSLQGLPVAAVA